MTEAESTGEIATFLAMTGAESTGEIATFLAMTELLAKQSLFSVCPTLNNRDHYTQRAHCIALAMTGAESTGEIATLRSR